MSEFTKKRARIFAGPNGAGKSTLYHYLVGQKYFTPYFYLNPDDLAKGLVAGIDTRNWQLDFDRQDFLHFMQNSTYNDKTQLNLRHQVLIDGELIYLAKNCDPSSTSYIAAALGEYLRNALLQCGTSFAFETVFSHPSKLAFIDAAKEFGYKTYLYFISTDAPEINIERVNLRVQQGGHFVEKEKVESRYYKTMANLLPALQKIDDAYVFDNSRSSQESLYDYFARINNQEITFVKPTMPSWFDRFVMKKVIT